ncbi:phosphogluconate dehydratase [Hyphomonas neptunium ATCC 15444]|uniref:Phosphogluconate dehydratase n=2 Tax=Hyphomonas TaxID=85 RepID=Q0C1E9_HYPNA|nr:MULTISPECIES: phosphogluconate dehydratase [Hyphomonas]ABI75937.1 phosphogluconate dehydratase [Hyphomonas neptunium ATCC 15444]KCZ95143.1 phosphogluconate dehydratase [Hyphomonas hirschiana VP5]
MTPLHPVIADVTQRIEARSRDSRAAYLEMIRSRRPKTFARTRLHEGNIAHASAGCAVIEKSQVLGAGWPVIGIITSYNDMLSAHAPFENFPQIIREAAREVNAVAQVAGGVPAMCDGVTQGQEGMELSLFSRDIIAMASAIGLSHDSFDAALHLGVCDKIVPGLVIAALRFGWLPSIFVPAGPMPSGLPNPEKVRIRQLFAEGKVDRSALLKAEAESYHSQGTCTFYGTANSNQMMMEVMGLHLPGAAFTNPGTPLRAALTRAATQRAAAITAQGDDYRPAGEMIDARSIVNAIVGLMATGGSTNHALHIPAMAAAAGLDVTLEDFADISHVTPLLARIYPNGGADVNHFHAAGGMGFLVRELLDVGLLHGDAPAVSGTIADYGQEPFLKDGDLAWRPAPETSGDLDVLRPASDPFSADGGLRLMDGPLGRGVSKVSAVKPENRIVEAPAIVFDTQEALREAFDAGRLDRDFVAVVRFQGPAANGMPELHGLSPVLGVLQDRGFKVALVTDGRMSGASGKITAAIHVAPEAARGGPLARVQDGDIIRVDGESGRLELKVDQSEFAGRAPAEFRPNRPAMGLGREMFDLFRQFASTADSGASPFRFLGQET